VPSAVYSASRRRTTTVATNTAARPLAVHTNVQTKEGTHVSETKITVIYDNPSDPVAFEAAYDVEQLTAARAIPGHIRFESSIVWPKEDGSPTPAYRMIDLYYPSYESASAAVATPEAGTFFEAMARLSTGGVRVLFSDIQISSH
jgi:uncharacterized protein (TIGR02118 family)